MVPGAGLLLVLLCIGLPLRLHALRHGEDDEDGGDRVGIFQTMRIAEGHAASDVVCAFCTVQVDGDVHGDVAVLFSTLNVAPGRTVGGDVATLFSTLVVGEGARVNGDLATAFSSTSIPESAHVGGDKAIFSSGIGLGVLFAPLLIVAGVIWLVVWGVRRMSY